MSITPNNDQMRDAQLAYQTPSLNSYPCLNCKTSWISWHGNSRISCSDDCARLKLWVSTNSNALKPTSSSVTAKLEPVEQGKVYDCPDCMIDRAGRTAQTCNHCSRRKYPEQKIPFEWTRTTPIVWEGPSVCQSCPNYKPNQINT